MNCQYHQQEDERMKIRKMFLNISYFLDFVFTRRKRLRCAFVIHFLCLCLLPSVL